MTTNAHGHMIFFVCVCVHACVLACTFMIFYVYISIFTCIGACTDLSLICNYVITWVLQVSGDREPVDSPLKSADGDLK